MGGKPSTSTPADQRLAANKLSDSQRQTLADKGQAMPSGAFPIRNRADLAKAIMAIGRAKDPQAARRWIIRRARELGATDLLPSSWNVKA